MEEEENKRAVRKLYSALACGDAETAQKVLASDLEWWFHGPPSCQHLMRLLTGASTHHQFCFTPQTITAFADKVFAEGEEEKDNVYWVHVWTLKDGIITQIREYFNTSLVVREFNRPSDSPSSSLVRQKHACSTIWQSELLCKSKGKSMPGLILAI